MNFTKIKKAMSLIEGWFALRVKRFFSPNIVFSNVRTLGAPVLLLEKGGRLELGGKVLLNSFNDDYHLSMYSPVKLVVRSGAVISIGEETRFHASCINARQKVVLGKRCLVAANCQIMDSNAHEIFLPPGVKRIDSVDEPRAVFIGDDVWLGTGVVVLPGANIPCGAVVPAYSKISASTKFVEKQGVLFPML